MKYSLILFAIILISFANLASALVSIGNGSDITKIYTLGDKLSGKINLSFEDESANSTIASNFNGGINLNDFLDENNANYTCSNDCRNSYNSLNGETGKTFNFKSGESKLLGLKIDGKVTGVNSISFDLSSNAQPSCISPLTLDILNDQEENWKFQSASEEFGCAKLIGKCFQDSTLEIGIDEGLRCEKVALVPREKYQIGAWIKKSGTANLTASLYNLNLEKIDSCTLPDALEIGGEVGCIINPNITEANDYYVCINADKDSGYKIQYEQSVEKCGFYGLDTFTGNGEYNSDYNVFAKPAEYAAVNTVSFNNSVFESASGESLSEYVWNYIDTEFNGDCLAGCVIPMELSVGAAQTAAISNVDIDFNTDIKNNKTSNLVYDLQETPAKINSDFLMLDLDYSNITISSGDGIKDFILYINSNQILTEKISISRTSLIESISPTIAYPGVETTFLLNLSANANVSSFSWDFGDGETGTSSTSSITHTYSNAGNYALEIVAESGGMEISKEFQITVGNAAEILNYTFKIYNERIGNLSEQVSKVPAWLKTSLEDSIGLNELKTQIKNLEQSYDSNGSDATETLTTLLALNVPISMQETISSTIFIPSPESINPALLSEFGVDVSDAERYKDAIAGWMLENLDSNLVIEVYILNYPNEQKPILTEISLEMTPKADFSKETYLIIAGSNGTITFKEDYGQESSEATTGIIYPGLVSGNKISVEFSMPGKITAEDLPAFLSPDVSEFAIGNILPCNSNKKCEKDIGEDYKNCPSDCRNWRKTIIYLVILLIIAFVVYIIMQEWYKRHYESHLFKNKVDLYNIIFFVRNALNNHVEKREIARKLLSFHWTREQIVYAVRKAQGKRTGMWEIPIFRPFERKKLQQEMEKRRNKVLLQSRQSL